MKDFFKSIQFLFEEFFFLPFNSLRSFQEINWWIANGINFLLFLIGLIAFIYWMIKLKNFNDKGEENKDITAHSFL
ncbi:MAG: uracil phosphoribosyltransferase [Flavobacteriaceae bacterium]|nr:uracil phosphoribosyltransferase [Flavobacteriaceae bacterium]